MWIWISLLFFGALDAPASTPAVVAGAQVACAQSETASLPDDGRGTPFVVQKADNICGLDEPRQITTPAKVDYDALLEETAEVRELKKNGIDPTSSKGITLMTKARSRVLKACESVRTEAGYDSVWKAITRRDSRAIPDVTDSVKAKLSTSGD
ncbi:MAG: hypothetical protein R3F49_09195 [Planctomycetota bacterium]